MKVSQVTVLQRRELKQTDIKTYFFSTSRLNFQFGLKLETPEKGLKIKRVAKHNEIYIWLSKTQNCAEIYTFRLEKAASSEVCAKL